MSAKRTSRIKAAGRDDVDLELDKKRGGKRGNQASVRTEAKKDFCFLKSTPPSSSESGVETTKSCCFPVVEKLHEAHLHTERLVLG